MSDLPSSWKRKKDNLYRLSGCAALSKERRYNWHHQRKYGGLQVPTFFFPFLASISTSAFHFPNLPLYLIFYVPWFVLSTPCNFPIHPRLWHACIAAKNALPLHRKENYLIHFYRVCYTDQQWQKELRSWQPLSFSTQSCRALVAYDPSP